jgi:hypothetical protein
MVVIMSVWALLAFGFAGLLFLSLLVGLSIGSILAHISREVSFLLESEPGSGADATSMRWTLSAPAALSASASARPANRG